MSFRKKLKRLGKNLKRAVKSKPFKIAALGAGAFFAAPFVGSALGIGGSTSSIATKAVATKALSRGRKLVRKKIKSLVDPRASAQPAFTPQIVSAQSDSIRRGLSRLRGFGFGRGQRGSRVAETQVENFVESRSRNDVGFRTGGFSRGLRPQPTSAPQPAPVKSGITLDAKTLIPIASAAIGVLVLLKSGG